NLDPALQQDATCVFTNKHKPTLTLTKVVHNNFGGQAVPNDFNLYVSGTNVLDMSGNPIASNQPLKSGTTVIMDGGSSFSGIEIMPPPSQGYTQESSAGCSGTLAFNDQKTCTITNKDIQPLLTIVKHVINNNGGTATAGNFTMSVSGTNVSNASFAGAEAGVTVTLNQGAFGVIESSVIPN